MSTATAPFPVIPGKIDIHVLYQDEVWVDIKGNVKRLTDMDAGHRINTLRFIERRTRRFYEQASLIAIAENLANMDDDGIEWGYSVHDDPCFMRPDEWLNRQPLVGRLRELVEQDLARPFAEQRLAARNWLWKATHRS